MPNAKVQGNRVKCDIAVQVDTLVQKSVLTTYSR